jgi:hypothetical protein
LVDYSPRPILGKRQIVMATMGLLDFGVSLPVPPR